MRQFAFAYLFNRFFTCIFRRYRHYQDQRRLDFFHHFDAGIKGQLRFQGRIKQGRFNKILERKWKDLYYIVPLQVHCDSQITVRSDFKSIEEFITLVVHSFAEHAPSDTKLIFKVHPMDRGYADYADFIKDLDMRFDTKRLLYLDRIHNPTALENARGCITINSSMGISALVHGIPVITLGRASFDLPELTFQGSLEEFWIDAPRPDAKHVQNFINLLKQSSQGHGTFYKRLFAVKGESKIQWPEEFKYLFPD
jgi:capsular polysaccharide export protein